MMAGIGAPSQHGFPGIEQRVLADALATRSPTGQGVTMVIAASLVMPLTETARLVALAAAGNAA